MARRSQLPDEAGGPPAAPDLTLLAAALRELPLPVRVRGQRYLDERRVGSLQWNESTVSTIVRGTESYAVSWEWNGCDWLPSCDCPVGPACKHAYALGRCVLHAGDVSRGANTVAAETPTAASRAELAALAQLRGGRDGWERQAGLTRLLNAAPRMVFVGHTPAVLETLRIADPDLRCWRLAQVLPAYTGGWVPTALQPYAHREDLADRFSALTREATLNALLQWAGRPRAAAQRRLRLLCGLQPYGTDGVGLTIETRLTSARLQDAPRSMQQLSQLRSSLHDQPELLDERQAALLHWMVERQIGAPQYAAGSTAIAPSQLSVLLDLFGGDELITWAETIDPAIAARAGITSGAPVRWQRDGVRLIPSCTMEADDVRIDLRFVWPDGRERRLVEACFVSDRTMSGRSTVVIADGVCCPVLQQPPDAVIDRFRVTGGLTLARAAALPVLTRLAATFPHVRDRLAVHTHHHRVRTTVTLDLTPDESLILRIYACNEDWKPGEPAPAVAFEYRPDAGWARLAGEISEPIPAAYGTFGDHPDAAPLPASDLPAPAPADVWLELPAPDDVGPVLEWLARAPVAGRPPDDGRPAEANGWHMPLTSRKLDALAAAWEQRPENVAFYGTERVRRLLGRGTLPVVQLHIESSGIDWLSISAEWESEAQRLTPEDVARLRSAQTRFVKLGSGWVRRDDLLAAQGPVLELLAQLGVEPGGRGEHVSMLQLAGAAAEHWDALQAVGTGADTLAAIKRLRRQVEEFAGVPRIPVPPGFTAALRPYQQYGLDFLTYAGTTIGGAVLADDMGLGKTVQALAWIAHVKATEAGAPQPTLVVCPASVVHNWQREAARFAPQLSIALHTRGELRHRGWDDMRGRDLVVTNYALLRRDLDQFRVIEWRAVILDEAQNIKNPDAQVTRAAQALPARYRLALTGTPLENRLLDLWSIVSFVSRGYLGTRQQFAARFDRVDAPAHMRTLLSARLRPILLRRTKQAVAPELPPRVEERRDCELTKGQRQLYLAELARSRALVQELGHAGGIARNKITILAALTRLRQICCHPALAGGKANLGSGKFEALFELLEPLLAEGHKVLLFSQFVECLKLVAAEMRARGIGFHTLTGATVKREQVVNRFQEEPGAGVFLISLKAGGTGLNLTAASYVVLFDPWWNPAVEAQAIDRTHRIGQDRTVIAYRLLTLGTIEEKIWELQQRKAAMVRDVLGENGFARTLTRADLDYLLADEP